jgi:multiple sugar transport system permease protein
MSVDTRPASGERAATRPVRTPRSGVTKGQLKKSQTIAPWVLLAPFLAVFLLTFVLPIIYAVFQSFTTVRREGLFGEQGVTTVFAGFENYALALANDAFTASIGRVLLFGIVQVPVMIILCTILALLLESASAKWPQFFRAAYFMPYGVPGVIATILWGFLYIPGVQLDFLSAGTVLWSIANIVTWTYTGYNMLIIIAQLKSIPGDVYEAARIDGAGAWRTALSIQLPLIRPALVLATVFSIIGTLQLFAEPQVLAVSAPAIDSQYTPNLSAYTTAFAYNDYGVAAAQAVIIALAAFVLSFVFLAFTNRKPKEEREAAARKKKEARA